MLSIKHKPLKASASCVFVSECLMGVDCAASYDLGNHRCRIPTLEEKMDYFLPKIWVTVVTKIRPGIASNWKIFEYNWLDIESQIDSNILQLFRIPGLILVPPVTQLLGSKWLHFFFQCMDWKQVSSTFILWM